MTVNAAKIIKSDRGTLREGAPADVTVIDPKNTWTVDTAKFHGKSRNCPFHGSTLSARPVATIVAGEVKWKLT